EAMVGERLRNDAAAVAAGQARCTQPHRARRTQRRNHILGVTGGSQGNKQIAATAERLDLTGKDIGKTHIVPRRRQGRTVGGQRDCRESSSRRLEADSKLGGYVLAVRGAAAIAAEQELAP